MTRGYWKRSVRRGGLLWQIGGWAFLVGILAAILKGCIGLGWLLRGWTDYLTIGRYSFVRSARACVKPLEGYSPT